MGDQVNQTWIAAVNSGSVFEKKTVSVHIIPLKIKRNIGTAAYCHAGRYYRPDLPIARTKYFSFQLFVTTLNWLSSRINSKLYYRKNSSSNNYIWSELKIWANFLFKFAIFKQTLRVLVKNSWLGNMEKNFQKTKTAFNYSSALKPTTLVIKPHPHTYFLNDFAKLSELLI